MVDAPIRWPSFGLDSYDRPPTDTTGPDSYVRPARSPDSDPTSPTNHPPNHLGGLLNEYQLFVGEPQTH